MHISEMWCMEDLIAEVTIQKTFLLTMLHNMNIMQYIKGQKHQNGDIFRCVSEKYQRTNKQINVCGLLTAIKSLAGLLEMLALLVHM